MQSLRSNLAFRLGLVYILLSGAYILTSDQLLARFIADKEWLTSLQTIKGWGFVLASGVLIWLLLQREIKALGRATRALSESERVLASLMANLPGMVYRCRHDRDRTMEFVSDGCFELTGYHPADLVGNARVSYGDSIYPDDRERVWEEVGKSVTEGVPFRLTYRITTPSGARKCVWEQGRAVVLPEMDGMFLEGFITDITERRLAEEEARRSAVQKEALSAIIQETSKASDLPQLLEEALDHTLAAFSLHRGAIWLADHSAAKHLPAKLVAQIAQTEDGVAFQGPIVVEDWGRVPPMGMSAEPAADLRSSGVQASLFVPILAEGRPIGGFCLAADTPHHWSESEMTLADAVGRQLGGAAERLGLLETTQEQASLLQRILDTVQEGILTLDVDRRMLLANPAAKAYLPLLTQTGVGESLTMLAGRPLAELLAPRPDGLPHEVVLQGPPERVFEVIPNPVVGAVDRGGWTLLIRDVTDIRQAQQQIQEQERRAAVGQLAAGIAHDFNNIMASVILYTEMMLTSPGLPPKSHERLTTILEQAQRAGTLTRQILDFSRRGIMEPHPMDLIPFMKETEKILSRTMPESIRVRFSYGDQEYIVSSDPARMQQVFMNLALNAREAMPSGGDLSFEVTRITLTESGARPLPEMPAGEWVCVRVSDTGAGIPAKLLPRIFEPYVTTKPERAGTGLGLAQVIGIIKQHDGYIEATSQEGDGSTFTIYLPALSPSMLRGVIREAQVTRGGEKELVLVVEDDLATRRALCEILESLNYRVLSAEDGRQALALFDGQDRSIDLVLSDLVMPEMGGADLYKALRLRSPSVKMVVMTGYPLAEGGRELLEQGIVAWIQKPMDTEDLARVLQEAFQRDVS
ncbi:MAG TPA: ATP-binding protein [Anaerolineales bacterium]|nr:ATP-binding protein [Anaerolineales bacterium]